MENLLPGPYRVALRSSGRLLRAEALLQLVRGQRSRLLLAPPTAELTLDLQTADGRVPEQVEVERVERRVRFRPDGSAEWESWGGFIAQLEGGTLRLTGLPGGVVRVLIVASGYHGTWSEPCAVAEGSAAHAEPVRLRPGHEIVVHLETPPGHRVSGPAEFFVSDVTTGRRVACRTRPGDDARWILSAFAPGEYRIRIDAGRQYAWAEAVVTVDAEREAKTTVALELITD